MKYSIYWNWPVYVNLNAGEGEAMPYHIFALYRREYGYRAEQDPANEGAIRLVPTSVGWYLSINLWIVVLKFNWIQEA